MALPAIYFHGNSHHRLIGVMMVTSATTMALMRRGASVPSPAYVTYQPRAGPWAGNPWAQPEAALQGGASSVLRTRDGVSEGWVGRGGGEDHVPLTQCSGQEKDPPRQGQDKILCIIKDIFCFDYTSGQ